jgi:hypothetical protein
MSERIINLWSRKIFLYIGITCLQDALLQEHELESRVES